MRDLRTPRRLAAMAMIGGLLAAACGTSETTDPEPSSSSTASEPGDTGTMDAVLTDIGVTDAPCPDAVNPDNGCIYLGIISDITEGPFAALGVEVVSGNEAFWAAVNADGGIGGYDVNVTEYTRDNKYNPEEHVTQYKAIEPNVLALAQSLGTPTTLAALESMIADNMIAVPASWWSGNVFQDNILDSGTSYCVEAMNGLDWAGSLDDTGFVADGISSVMAVHYPGDYGDDAAAGVAYWAEQNGADFPDDNNVTTAPNAIAGNQDGPVGAILAADPDLVYITTGPLEAAEIMGKAAASGYTGRFLGSSPTWNPALMANPDLAAVLPIIYRNVAPWGSYGSDTGAHAAMMAQMGDDLPSNDGFTSGWMWQYPLKAAIEQAIDNGDLTRAGLLAAVKQISVDYDGAMPARSYGGGSADAFRQNVIGQPDPDAALGITTITEYFEGETATAFPYTEPCSG